MMNEPILKMKNVTKQFPGVVALNNVNLSLEKAEILGICGENGAGKSTLMKILSGGYPTGTYDGEIYINGKLSNISSVAVAESFGIEMVYQELSILADASVAENMYIGNLPGKGPWVDYKKLYKDTLERLNTIHLNVNPRTLAKTLNSGQLQLVALMHTYVKKPRILILDEPTSALTDSETNIMMDLLRKLKSEGVSCIYISHKLEEVYQICDRVLVLRDGMTVACHSINDVSQDTLIEEMVGRKIENMYPKISPIIGDEVFRVENLTVPHPAIPEKNIVENISFNLRKGEIFGVGGLVGSGRTEVLSALFGQLTKGVQKKVYIDGKEVKIQYPSDAIQAGMGFLTEEKTLTGLVWMLTIRENITLASLSDLLGNFFINQKDEKQKAQYMFNRMQVKAPSIESIVTTLSGGNQQKVVLGKWLLKRPKILLIDEPTKGIDVGAKAEIYKLLGELTKSGMSIIMVSSDMPEFMAMCDRCIVLSNGHISSEFNKDEISEEALMRASISLTTI